MVYNLIYNFGAEGLADKEVIERQRGRGIEDLMPDYRKRRNKDNNWLIDRQAQKNETFTGIEGINTQDHAIQESMGPIVDRSNEHLGLGDKAIIATRRLLTKTVQTVQGGGDPRGLGVSYYPIRAIEKVLPEGVDWRQQMMDELRVHLAMQI
jgi:hypothetical protein